VFNVRILFLFPQSNRKIEFVFFYITEHFAQMVNQQASTGTNTQPTNNNNNNINIQDSLLRSAFVVQPDPPSSTRSNETLRSRSADSRPSNTNNSTSNIDDDDADWIDLPAMDIPMPPPPPPPQLPNAPIIPIPRIRGPAIIRMLWSKTKILH
jgi:hypothetical protein